MKLNAETNPGDSDSSEHCPEPAACDRAVSKAGLYQSLQENQLVAAENRHGLLMAWMNKTTSWVAGKLWSKVAVGYEDEGGFHYGIHPDDQEAHEGSE